MAAPNNDEFYYPDTQTAHQQVLWWDTYSASTETRVDNNQYGTVPNEFPVDPRSTGRYGNYNVSNDEMVDFIRNQIPKNTVRKHRTDINQLYKWLALTHDEHRQIWEIPPNELDELLCKYFYSTRKRDGTEYEPETLQSFSNSIDRVLLENGYQTSIKSDREFAATRLYRRIL